MAIKHSLLRRQLKRHFGADYSCPQGWSALLEAVDLAYEEFDNDRKMLERSLELSSQELLQATAETRAILQALPDLLLRLGRDGTILNAKAGNSEDLMLRDGDLVGRSFREVPLLEEAVGLEGAFSRAQRTGAVVSLEFSRPRTGPGSDDYEARFVPARDDQAIVIIRNVTERKSLEAQLRQSQKMEGIGQLAGGVAHDFNNLLTVIIGYTQLLLSEEVAPAERRELLEEIHAASKRAGRLTHQLLAFSRKQAIRLQSIDLNEVVGELGKMLQRVIGESISLALECDPGLPPIKADAGMIEQVLMNLAVNARDAMPEGGRLTISTIVAPRGGAPGAAVGAAADQWIALRVRDSGCGMSPEIRTRIFEPFFTTKETGKGTGLGLATVFGIVQQHHGSIQVESDVGRGTTFTILLPAAQGEAAAEPPEGDDARPGMGSETVLLVEDDALVRQFAHRVLERAGYQVIDAASAPDALAAWNRHSHSIALLLTDLILPDGPSGNVLARRLQADQPGLRVVFASGYASLAAREGVDLRPGVNFLPKPYLPWDLCRIVRTSLDRTGSAPAAAASA